jgi:AcrR family transcriptional regulator
MSERHDDGDRRSRILEAAAHVISERGVDRARLADIAEAAGVSLGLVQHYFRHRERLLAEVFRRESERIGQTWQTVVPADAPPLERLVDYIRLCTPDGSSRAARSFGPGWAFWFELWSKANREEALRTEVPGIYRSFARPFIDAIEAGVAAGEFHPRTPVEDIVDRLVSQIDGSAVRTVLGALPDHRMLALLVDALCLELGLDEEQTAHAHELAIAEAASSR